MNLPCFLFLSMLHGTVNSWSNSRRHVQPYKRFLGSSVTLLSSSSDSIRDPSHRWISVENLSQISQATLIPLQTILDWYVDVSVFLSDQKSTLVDQTPSYVRLRSSLPQILSPTALHKNYVSFTDGTGSDRELSTISVSQFVASATLRWCSDFVAAPDLNLCPWAKGSLATNHAIRIKILLSSPSDRFIDLKLEQLIRSSAKELVHVTELTNHNSAPVDLLHYGTNPSLIKIIRHPKVNLHIPTHVDPNAAITFVVAAEQDLDVSHPGMINRNDLQRSIFNFANFYDFATDLEDRLLDEDETAEDVTIAPFHPEWSFAQEEDEDSVGENPLDYEKRSPFPTISLVRTKVILKAGEDATERIAQHNEQVLNQYDTVTLKNLYQQRIWNGPEM